jgi:N-acetylmuramoyl-L-alanine amidase
MMKVSRKLRISFSNNWVFFYQIFILILLISVPLEIANAEDLPVIVLDPGHGGTDVGAKGYYHSTEKKITLTLANRIALQLRKRYDVVLTRKTDVYVPLAERTAIANHAQAIAFISLHVGASFRLYPQGIRTYYWHSGQGENYLQDNPHNNKDRNIEMQPLLWDHIQRYHLNSSKQLAQYVHNSILSQVNMNDRKIGGCPLFVLTGADMPAIMIEIAYISRPKSENNLLRIPYLDKISRGVALGIDQFINKNAYDLKTDLHF